MSTPKLLHFVWVGDESRCPHACIDSWRELNPTWDVILWGNDVLDKNWRNARHIREMYDHELKGVANLLRWEIIYRYGGFALDADSICVRPLDKIFEECDLFSCWENELQRQGLISASVIGGVPKSLFLWKLIEDLHLQENLTNDRAWKTCGTLQLSNHYHTYKPSNMTIFPSHFFLPKHYTGQSYTGSGPVYAHQLWAETLGIDASDVAKG